MCTLHIDDSNNDFDCPNNIALYTFVCECTLRSNQSRGSALRTRFQCKKSDLKYGTLPHKGRAYQTAEATALNHRCQDRSWDPDHLDHSEQTSLQAGAVWLYTPPLYAPRSFCFLLFPHKRPQVEPLRKTRYIHSRRHNRLYRRSRNAARYSRYLYVLR